MKKKHFVIALAVVMVTTFVSVLAQKNIIKAVNLGSSMSPNANSYLALEKKDRYTVNDQYQIRSNRNYTNSVTGGQNAPATGVINPLYLELNVNGELSGSWKGSIQYNNSKEVVGGEWTQTVIKNNPDGTTTTIGTLKGTFYGGNIALNESGSTVTTVNDVGIIIESGTGTYSTVNTGSGNLSGTFDNAVTPTFNGTLNLDF